MKKSRVFALVLSLFFFLLTASNAKINKLPGQWSISASSSFGATYGVSHSTQGTLSSMESDYLKYNDFTQFPFSDVQNKAFNSTFMIAYNFPESPWSLFLAADNTMFTVDNELRTIFGSNMMDKWAKLHVTSFLPGVEYAIGKYEDMFNVFGRVGVGLNLISGNVRYGKDYADLMTCFRVGVFSEFGIRYNFKFMPVSLELSCSYTNANLFGKTRNEFIQTISEINFNDASDPHNSAIPNKTLDFVSVKLGTKIWF